MDIGRIFFGPIDKDGGAHQRILDSGKQDQEVSQHAYFIEKLNHLERRIEELERKERS